MTAITRGQLMKELLPGLNALFGEEYRKLELDGVKRGIAKSDEEFVSKEVYLKVVQDYEERIQHIQDSNTELMERVARTARKDGVQKAASYVEGMAEEIGNSNLLHAVVLALRNMDVPE